MTKNFAKKPTITITPQSPIIYKATNHKEKVSNINIQEEAMQPEEIFNLFSIESKNDFLKTKLKN